MIHAKDFEIVKNDIKQIKFDKMIKIQEKKIKENMEEGARSVVWCFNDIGYYLNDLEKKWYQEFNTKAKILFEKQGFNIGGDIIRW
jgi:hypothetical protein